MTYLTYPNDQEEPSSSREIPDRGEKSTSTPDLGDLEGADKSHELDHHAILSNLGIPSDDKESTLRSKRSVGYPTQKEKAKRK